MHDERWSYLVLREEVKGTVKLKKRLKGKKGPTVLELTLGKLFCEIYKALCFLPNFFC